MSREQRVSNERKVDMNFLFGMKPFRENVFFSPEVEQDFLEEKLAQESKKRHRRKWQK